MKKSNLVKRILIFYTILFSSACTKSNQIQDSTYSINILPKSIVSNASFVALNEAIVKFDPLYLQVRFKEKRSIKEIQLISTSLIIDIIKNPNNEFAQNELAKLYHFESFIELKNVSDVISKNAFTFNNTIQSLQISKIRKNNIIEARKIFIQNKIETLKESAQKRTTGLWNDMVDEILLELHYWILIQNEELELDNTGSPECQNACCYEYKSCLTKAASSYRLNFITIGSSLAAAGGSLGVIYGSVIPFLGNLAAGTGGGIIGGVAGFIQAVNIYLKDQEACLYTYKACLIRQKG